MVFWYNKSTLFERNFDFASLHLYIVLYSNLEILSPTHNFKYAYIADFVSIMCMIILFIQHTFILGCFFRLHKQIHSKDS